MNMTELVPLHSPDQQSHRHPELVSGSIPPQVQRPANEEWMLKRVQHDDARKLGDRLKSQLYCEIMPVGVLAFDQIDLPLPVPALELLLTRDGSSHLAKHLEPDEPMDMVSFGKPLDRAAPMLKEPGNQIARDANVECAMGLIGEDIDAGVALELHELEYPARWTLKQVQGDAKVLKT